jgi:hypothetical protein
MQKAIGHEDAAQRIADTYALHRLGAGYGAIGKWFAAALHDGRSDNVLYDTKQEAVRFQHHNEQYFTFIKINPHTMNACEAAVMLKTARFAANHGMRLADPQSKTGGKDLIKRLTVEDQRAQSVGRNTNLTMPWEA